jgi:2-desacetyl-2-hydroxyethyl bacteriochlorophyllide A dehydrogenase
MHGLCVTALARAVEFAAPRRVRIREVALPPVDTEDVVVRTRCSGISSGTELLAYRGGIDSALPLDAAIGALGGTFTYPFRYGYSCVGVVEQGPPNLTPGTLVFAFHPHQDVFVVPAAVVVELGDIDPRTATLFPMVETALQISVEAAALTGQAVVIIGLGLVGLLTSLLVQRETAVVLGVDPLGWRRDVAQRLGIDAVAPEDVAHALDDRGLDGVPLVIEASGNPAALSAALGLLAHEGTALVASWYGTAPVSLPLGAEFHRRRLTIRSTQVSSIPAALADRWTVAQRREAARRLLGELPLEVLATHTFAFEQAADAYAALDRREEGLIHAALGYE